MPPRTSVSSRAGKPEPQPAENAPRHGAAVRSEMPPLPSRLMTSYGSQTVAPLINIRRGKRRELGDAIGEALRDPTEELSEMGSPRASAEPFQQDPLPELVTVPEEDPDDLEMFAMGSDDDFQPPESDQGWSAPPSPAKPTRRGNRRTSSRAPSVRPEPPTPQLRRSPRGSTSSRSTSQSDELALNHPPARRVTRSSRARSINPAPEPVAEPASPLPARRSSSRRTSVAPTQNLGKNLMPPPDVPSNGTDRSFHMESDIYGNVSLASVRSELASTPPSSPPAPPSSIASIRESLTRARGRLRYTTNSLARGQQQARDFLFGTRPGAAAAEQQPSSAASNGSAPSSTKAASSSLGAAGRTVAPQEKTPSPPSSPSRLRPGRIWRAIKPSRSLWEYIRSLFIIAILVGFIWNIPKVCTPDYSSWDPAQTWDTVTHTFENINPFMSPYSNASVDAAHRAYKTLVKQSLQEIDRLQKSSKMYEGSVKKLEELMPQVVHMEVRNGKPAIPDDFWHALRDLVKADEDIVSIQGSRTGPRFTSGKHWDAVLTHINDDLGSGHRLAAGWLGWLKTNRIKVLSALQLDETAPAPSLDANMKDALNKLIKERLQGPELSQTVVTRDEFVRHMRGEFATHRQEIRTEMKELETKVETRVQQALKAIESAPTPISAREVKQMVRDAVHEELGKAQLGALARGGVHRSWAADLRHRVNLFAVGNGAVVNPLKSSPTYVPPRAPFASRAWLGSGNKPAPMPYNSVLLPWDDSGDGWCGANTVDRQGRPNGVALNIRLGRSVTPEHIVVEHILPDATLEPDARPREIELWVQAEGVELQQRLLDFAASHFPPRPRGGEVPPVAEARCDGSECFYLVGRFEYESNPLQGGVFVHKLSDELGPLGVRTDNVRVVASSNFGDAVKTCFYRLRLYGEVAEGV